MVSLLDLAPARRALLRTTTCTLLLVLVALRQQHRMMRRMVEEWRTSSSSSSFSFSSRPPGPCSCLNSHAPRECCRRSVLRAHKFGYLLANEFFGALRDQNLVEFSGQILPAYFPSPGPPAAVARSGRGGSSSSSGTQGGRGNAGADYRHVVFTRNFYEAFVSGYLYHKSGRECWLSSHGRANWTTKYGQEGILDWKVQVERAQRKYPYVDLQGMLTPASNTSNVSLCRFLADHASELDGMNAYIAFGLAKLYPGLMEYLQVASERNAQAEAAWSTSSAAPVAAQKSLFVCMEEAADPLKKRGLYCEMMAFLYPGGHNYTCPPMKRTTGGRHASDPDPKVRRRLLGIVKRLDLTVYRGDLTRINHLMDCNGTIH